MQPLMQKKEIKSRYQKPLNYVGVKSVTLKSLKN